MSTIGSVAQGSVAQGVKLLQNSQKKIKEGFSRNQREGFTGILGSNAEMDRTMARDLSTTQARSAVLNKNIKNYSDNYAELQTKTDVYLNDAENNYTLTKNYNVFINKSLNQDKIDETNILGCVNFAALAQNNLTKDNAFNTAYPDNFTNYADAENACKLWAADSNSTAYGLAQDSSSKYNCYHASTTIDEDTVAYTKPKSLYSVVSGDANASQGGLFKNGQIGTWSGKQIDPTWNIPNMTVPTLIKKYNSSDYSNGPAGVSQAVTTNLWGWPKGMSGGTGWGYNLWPRDTTAWWITSSDYTFVGTMGYFYYLYDNRAAARRIYIYIVSDDNHVLKVNGVVARSVWNYGAVNGALYVIQLITGKNVFEVKLINTGGPGAFVLYAAETSNYVNVLFTSNSASNVASASASASASAGTSTTMTNASPSTNAASPQLAYGWGYSSSPVADYNIITNIAGNSAHPLGLRTVNAIPNDYAKCDPFYGGGINVRSVTASYGRNCNNIANPPLNVRYVLIRANDRGECLQIAQVVVNAIVNGAIRNVVQGNVKVYASSVYRYGNANRYWAIDGTLAPRSFPHIYHSACNGGDFWMIDLGQEYPVVQIIYYNRSDCCSDRANGMKLMLFNGSANFINSTTLTGALKQTFSISTVGIR